MVFFALVSSISSGEAPISPNTAGKILGELTRQSTSLQSPMERTKVTDREMEVLRLVAQGKRNKDIAEGLTVSESTVKYHLRNILDKLHLENRAQVIAYATRRGLGHTKLE